MRNYCVKVDNLKTTRLGSGVAKSVRKKMLAIVTPYNDYQTETHAQILHIITIITRCTVPVAPVAQRYLVTL